MQAMRNALANRLVSELVQCAHTLRAHQYINAQKEYTHKISEAVKKIFDGSPRRVYYINVNNSLTRDNFWIGEVRRPQDARELSRQMIDGVTFRVQDLMLERFRSEHFDMKFGRMVRDTRKRELIDEAQVARPRKGFKGHVSIKDQIREHVYGILR